jgi:integrase
MESQMSRKPLNRKNGIQLDRLPNYNATSTEGADAHPKAILLCEEMKFFVAQKASVRLNGKQSSDRTIQVAVDVMHEFCCRLWRLGFRLETVSQIGGKHIEAVVRDYWACGASPKYFASVYSTLNKFQGWVGKPGLVRNRKVYLPEVDEKEFICSQVAVKSKSWRENGIDVVEKIKEADVLDVRFGLMLRMIWAFGLRRVEVMQIRPWVDDRVYALEVRKGIAKGGRSRNVYIETDHQRDVLDYVKSQINKTEFLGWPSSTFEQGNLLLKNKTRFLYLMRKIGISKEISGVTTHGLRAQYAEGMAVKNGWIPSTLGGTKNQLPADEEKLIRMQLAENLGHSRITVTSAYYGSASAKIQNSRGERISGIRISDGDFVSVYANPPPRARIDGKYPKLSKRIVEQTDFILVREDYTGEFAVEKSQFKFEIIDKVCLIRPFDDVRGEQIDPQIHDQIQPVLLRALERYGYF